jgi:hypothetical protein
MKDSCGECGVGFGGGGKRAELEVVVKVGARTKLIEPWVDRTVEWPNHGLAESRLGNDGTLQ